MRDIVLPAGDGPEVRFERQNIKAEPPVQKLDQPPPQPDGGPVAMTGFPQHDDVPIADDAGESVCKRSFLGGIKGGVEGNGVPRQPRRQGALS